MATLINAYSPYSNFQQSYHYPTFPSTYPIQPNYFNNFYAPQQPSMHSPQMPIHSQQKMPMQAPVQQQQRPQPQPQPPPEAAKHMPAIEYVGSGDKPLRPRRQPRVIRQVIVLPTPEPVYRQVRHRMPTPEREIIQRTIIQKANGEVVVQQQRPAKPRSQSRQEPYTHARSVPPRLVYTD